MGIQDNACDWNDLERAVALLTRPPVIIKLSNAIGSTVEAGINGLPGKVREGISEATEKGLLKSIEIAGKTLGSQTGEAWTGTHMLAAAASGAIGGFFGLGALLLEIPVTTTVMMRSILDIARSEGHDVSTPRIQLECLSVFSHGSMVTDKDDAAETGYYASRAAMAEMISEAAKSLSKAAMAKGAKGLSANAVGRALAKLIEVIAARFGIVVTEKAVLQAAPVLGAFAGAALNTLFMDFYQDTARGHFILLRLEERHGRDAVAEAFKAVRARAKAARGTPAP